MIPCPFFPACSEELTKEVNKPRMKKRTKLIEVHRALQRYNKYQPLEPGSKIDSCTRRRVIDQIERPVCSFSEQFRRRARLEMMTKGLVRAYSFSLLVATMIMVASDYQGTYLGRGGQASLALPSGSNPQYVDEVRPEPR